MLFKVLAGRHVQDGEVYSKGDIVETKLNLIETFGDLKFQREFELEAAAKAQVQTPKKAKDETIEPEEDETTSLGKDLTVRFSIAKKNGFLVFKKGNKFLVASQDEPTKALNPSGLKRSDVIKFIEDITKKD